MFKRVVALLLCFCLVAQQTGFAQGVGQVDVAAHLSHLAVNILPQDHFRPVHLRYLAFDEAADTFKLLLDKGDVGARSPRPGYREGGETPPLRSGLSTQEIQEETQKLMQYFHIGLALPNSTFWVNLRPDAPDNIIEDKLAQTDIGRIMLEADVQLKKDTAAFTSPDTPEGREYWDKLYKKAEELFGTEQVEIPTYTRPWIVPGEIILRETRDDGRGTQDEQRTSNNEQRSTNSSAYIYKATLKVMLEEDYIANVGAGSQPALQGRAGLEPAPTIAGQVDPRYKALNEYSSELIRQLIIPKITRAVNRAKRYAELRQVYYSLILAQWFKERNRSVVRPASVIPHPSSLQRIDSGNLSGLTSKNAWSKTTYFAAYQKSFKGGEYRKQETVYTLTGQLIRNYVSGGAMLNFVMPSFGEEIQNPETGMSISCSPAVNPPEIDSRHTASLEFKSGNSDNNEIIINKLVFPESSSSIVNEQSLQEMKKKLEELKQGIYKIISDADYPQAGSLKKQLKSYSNFVNSMGGAFRISRRMGIRQANSLIFKSLSGCLRLLKESLVKRSLKDCLYNLCYISNLTLMLIFQYMPPAALASYAQEDESLVSVNIYPKVQFYPTMAISFITVLLLANNINHKLIIAAGYAAFITIMSFFGLLLGHELTHVFQLAVIKQTKKTLNPSYSEKELVDQIDLESKLFSVTKQAPSPEKLAEVAEDIFNQLERILEKDGLLPTSNSASSSVAEGVSQESTSTKIEELQLFNQKNKENSTLGGIDLRSLPIVTQAITELSFNTCRIPLSRLDNVDLSHEWLRIKKMVEAGITPSTERIKEYIQLSCLKGEFSDMQKVVSCIADILRTEEDCCVSTDPALKDILIVLDSCQSPEQLKRIFAGPANLPI